MWNDCGDVWMEGSVDCVDIVAWGLCKFFHIQLYGGMVCFDV